MAKTNRCTPAADYRTDAPRVDGWTDERKAIFLLTLARTGVVATACNAAEMSVSSAYFLRREQRGTMFALGWKAAHLLARDLLEDRLLEYGLCGIESVVTKAEGITHRKAFSYGLSMAVLNRLDRRAAALDDPEMGLVRRLCARFDAFINLILAGSDEAALMDFMMAIPDPLGAPLASVVTPQPRAEAGAETAAREAAPAPVAARKAATANRAINPKLVEESATFSRIPTPELAASLIAIAAMAKRGASEVAMAA
jgi:hypothetical protein